MTHMAMFEKNESAGYSAFLNAERGDYVSFSNVLGFVVGTLFYAGFVTVALLLAFTLVITRVSSAVLVPLVVVLLAGYVAFLYVYRKWTHDRAVKRFDEAREKIRTVRRDWNTLEELYEEEEKNRAPSIFTEDEEGLGIGQELP